MTIQFSTLNLKTELIQNLVELEYKSMTPIQEQSLPILLEGRDVIAQAKTGSGKTAAFGLSILNSLTDDTHHIQSLVLCPTRELAEQVSVELRRLARKLKNIKILTIAGGTAEFHQEKSLAHGADIIVGTPGRVLRLAMKRSLVLKGIKSLVLDEADRMLDMGFFEDIMKINVFLPKKRHSMLFSATYPDQILDLCKSVLIEPVEIKVDVEHIESAIKEMFFELDSHTNKEKALLNILGFFKPERAIVFCKTKVITENVVKYLRRNGVSCDCLHGDMEQNDRTLVLTKFNNKSLIVLVATDVAARGIDIKELPMVVNFDLPSDPEIYVHRIGRTARAGNEGLAVNLFVNQEVEKLDEIESIRNKKCETFSIEDYTPEVIENLEPEMKTLYIAAGKKDKLRPGDILGAFVGEAKITNDKVGHITILNIISYVAVKEEVVDQVLTAFINGKIKNRKFRVGLA